MAETRAIWTELIDGVGVDFAEVFNQALEEYRPGISALLITGTGDGARESYFGKTGVGEVERFDDGDNIPGGRRYPTYKTEVDWNNYGKFIDVTKNTIEDRDFAADLDEMRDLGIAVNYSQDKSGMQIFNGAFATTTDVNNYRMTWYGDGEELFSTVHPTTVPGGSTQSNASSTSIPFNEANLETGFVALIEQQTDDGLAISLLGKATVVLPPALMKEGEIVTQSQLRPGVANNDINVYEHGMLVDMVTSTHLASVNGGSDTQWQLIVPQRAQLLHKVRQAPRMEKDVNIKNKVVTFTVDARWANVVRDWRRTYGSKGNVSDYSS